MRSAAPITRSVAGSVTAETKLSTPTCMVFPCPVSSAAACADAPFTPAVEIGWRLVRGAWGRGYATEAAREVLRFAFTDLGLDDLVSVTIPANLRSRAVMERLGLTRDPADDFDHPAAPEGHPM